MNNVAKPYSDRVELDIKKIKIIDVDKQELSIKKYINKTEVISNQSYAKNINVKYDLIKEGTVYNLENGYQIQIMKIEALKANSLNFSFEDFFLSQDSKLFIYSASKSHIMGPITNISNAKILTTHIIHENAVYIELYSKIGSNDKVIINKIAYGFRTIDDFINSDNEFEDLIRDNSKNQFSIQNNCSTYTKSNFEDDFEGTLNDCNHVGHYDYGNTGMKEANCNEFDQINKSKRAEVIIASYLCENEEWQWKPGILINTAGTSASTYCKSYILTCRHCLAGVVNWDSVETGIDPSYMAVRFNWIRNQCDINNMPNCSTNIQAWRDIINMDEVIDYTDVSYVSGYRRGNLWGVEYAFLEINSPLKHKEYFNGWKIMPYIYNQNYAITIDSYALGASGHSPLVARKQKVKYSAHSYADVLDIVAINGNSGLQSGYSGTSILDENGYLLGIGSGGGTGPNIGLLYADSPWLDPNIPIKPRLILDETGIFTSDFSNGIEITVEGAERWEKGDCFKSTYDCATGFDMADFITPVSNVDGLCCFKVEYVDPNTNFVGGKPFGLRIYRNTDKQETLHYSSGSAVFPNEDYNYYEPQNDYLIDFCIASDELDEDNNTIIFEFLDNNGKIICRQEVEVYCFDPCETCPENIDSWLGMTTDENDPLCDEDECKVTFDFEIPEGYECFTHISFSSTLDNAPYEPPTIVPASSFNISTLNKCLERGKEYKFTLKLMRGVNDLEPCVIVKEAYCDLYDDNPPCIPDCPQTPWVKQPDAQLTLSGCPGCSMNISYYSRFACGKYEIQITSLEKFGIGCNGTNCDDIETYVEAVAKIMNDNEMSFPFPGQFGAPCLTTFRISKSSCWATSTIGFYNQQDEFISIISLKPCNSDCCVREVTVCKDINNNYTLTTTSATSWPSCHDATHSYPSGPWTNCSYTCNFLNSTITLKQSYSNNNEESEIKKFKEEMNNPNNTYVKIQVNNSNEILNVNIEETNGKNISIKLFDMTGKQITELSEPLNSKNNFFNLSLSNLMSGSYLYSIEVDGKLAKSDNIIITR